jgi:hypothetical protein
VERAALDGAVHEHVALGLLEPVDASREHGLDAGRQRCLLGLRSDRHELLEEQRIALGGRQDAAGGGRVELGAGDRLDQRERVRAVERVEREHRPAAAWRRPGGAILEQLGAGEADDRDRRAGRERDNVLEQLEQRRVGPVRVLDDEHERALGGDRLEQPPHRPERLARLRRVVGEADRAEHAGGDRLGLVDARQRRIEPLRGRAAGELADHLRERPVRDRIAVGKAAPDRDRRRSGDVGHELAREPRLADPGRPDDCHQAARPVGAGAVEHGAQRVELALARDERRRARPERDRALGDEPEHAPGRHRRPPAAQRDRLELLRADLVLDELERVPGDQDLAVSGGRAEPGGDVHRVAARDRGAARAGADEDLARRDRCAHRDRDTEVVPQLRGQRCARLAQLERGAHGPQRIVLVALAEAEDADDGIAGVLLHDAAVALEHLGAERRAALERGVQRLRVEPLGQRGRVGDVGEHDAHEPARVGARRGTALAGVRRDADRRRRHERRVVREDRALELAQPLAGLDAELGDERATGLLVGLERVGLAIAAVEREHQLRAQALAVRVLADQALERADDIGVLAEREARVDELLERGHVKLLEPADLALRETLVREVGERRAAPQRQRLLERCGGGAGAAGCELARAVAEQPLEAVAVEQLGRERELVAVLARQQRQGVAVRGRTRECLAQARDLDVHHLGGGRRRRLAEQLVDQPLHREHLVGVEQQQREQRALPDSAERDRAPLVEHFERSEDVEVHGVVDADRDG